MNANSLYTTPTDKNRYYGTPELYINGFWVSLLCILGFRTIVPNQPKIKQILDYFYMILMYSQDGFERDDLPDHITAIKVLRDLGLININQVRSLFVFLDKNKNKVNQAELRRVLKSLPLYKIRPNSFYAKDINNFMDGKKTLEQITHQLFTYNSTIKRISGFVEQYGNIIRNDLLKNKG